MNNYQLNFDIIYNNKNPEALKRLTSDLCEVILLYFYFYILFIGL